MRKLIVTQYVSLDGVTQAPGHATEDLDGDFEQGGWTGPFMPDHGRYNNEFFPTAGAFLFGRRTYDIFAGYWPTVPDDQDEIARALNGLPKYVVSTTLTKSEWTPTTVISTDVAAAVTKLKRQPGKPILVVGSSGLTHTLIEHSLIDEYQLWLHPVVLGSGKRLFRDGGPRRELRLIDSKTTSEGLMILTYAPQQV